MAFRNLFTKYLTCDSKDYETRSLGICIFITHDSFGKLYIHIYIYIMNTYLCTLSYPYNQLYISIDTPIVDINF